MLEKIFSDEGFIDALRLNCSLQLEKFHEEKFNVKNL